MAETKLKRSIGLLGLTFVAISGMLGSGWLFAPELVAQNAGPASIISWVIGAIVILLLALTFAEVSAMLPVAGGLAQVPHFSHGNVVSSAMGWTAWVGYTLTAPIEVAAMLNYASEWIPFVEHSSGKGLSFWGAVFALGVMAVMVVINAWGVAFFSRINTGLTWIKILIPTVIVLAFLSARFEPGNFTTPTFSPFGWTGILAGVSTGGVIFAFIGFRHAIDLAGETIKPHRNIPLALCLGILFCFLIYAGAQIAYIGALPPGTLDGGWKSLDSNHDYGPFAALGVSLGILWVMSFIYGGSIIAPFGGGLVSTGSNARLALAMARNGQFPSFFSRLSPRGVPLNALVMNWFIGSAMLFILEFEEMLTLNGSSIVLSLTAGPIAVYALRAQLPDRERYFRIPAVALVAQLAFIAATLCLYWSGWKIVEVLIGLIAVGLVLFLVNRRLTGDIRSLDYRQAIWLPPYLIMLGCLSYFGQFGGTGQIPFGWDLLVAVGISIVSFLLAHHYKLPAEKVEIYVSEVEIGRDSTTLEPYAYEKEEKNGS